jgi:hypothetical protein
MAGLGDLIGANGVIEQLFLWGVVNQVISAMTQPAFQLLAQEAAAAHPEQVLDPATLATLAVRTMLDPATAKTEAAKSGISAPRFELLSRLAQVRVGPGDLATAVLRSYISTDNARAAAALEGMAPGELDLLIDLAGDAPGPQQLTQALLRGIIPPTGTGAGSISYAQGIAETRLHDKWGPVLEKLANAVLAPADAADAVVRNFMPHDAGAADAAKNGYSAADFETLVHLAGDAPGPQQLAEALRRNAIPLDGTGADSISFEQGIAEGRLANKWTPVIKALSQIWPTPVDALDATLKGQVTGEQGKALYELLGGDLQFYDWLFNSRGSAPTPLELIEMANRGVIAWDGTGPDAVSYAQGFLEGPWRDKWAPAYRALGVYVPPPSTVTQMLAQGSLTDEAAAALLAKQGMSEDIIAAFLTDAHIQALSPYRGLSVQTAVDAYKAHIIGMEMLTEILLSLHVKPDAIDLLIEYADMERAFAQVNTAVSRVRSLYAARKIPVQTARDALDALGIAAPAATEMIAAWQIENSISVKTLSESQIVSAWEYGVLTEAEALQELTNIGYTAFDSWVLLGIKAKEAQPNRPEQGAPPLQGAVIPGTT